MCMLDRAETPPSSRCLVCYIRENGALMYYIYFCVSNHQVNHRLAPDGYLIMSDLRLISLGNENFRIYIIGLTGEVIDQSLTNVCIC